MQKLVSRWLINSMDNLYIQTARKIIMSCEKEDENQSNKMFTEVWYHKRISDYLKKCNKNTLVLEVGIGRGSYLYLYPKGMKLVLGDLSIRKQLQEKTINKWPICQLDIRRLPFSDKTFDIVVLQETIAHIDDIEIARNEIYRILKTSGKLIMTTVIKGPLGLGLHKNKYGERVLEKSHINEFKSVKSLLDLFCKKGKFQLEFTEKRPIAFPIKKYLPKVFIEKVNIINKTLLPLPFYYYNLYIIFEKKI